jgi:hypothetical protein
MLLVVEVVHHTMFAFGSLTLCITKFQLINGITQVACDVACMTETDS